MCTLVNFESVLEPQFSVADYIYFDQVTYSQSSFSGLVGLSSSSPLWSVFPAQDGMSKIYQIQLQNLTDWTFLDPSYEPYFVGNYILFGDNVKTEYIDAPSLIPYGNNLYFELAKLLIGVFYEPKENEK